VRKVAMPPVFGWGEAMKLSNSFCLMVCAISLAATGKSAPVTTPVVPPVPPAASAAVTIPDFQTASVSQLSTIATQVLTSLGQTAAKSPAIADKVSALKTALAGNQASAALSSLAGLSAAAKGVPGAEGLAGSATQLVSAWALKQGFDLAKISGVLGALQKPDFAALASQGASVLSKGGLTGDQQGLVKGVMNAYGIDTTKAAGAASALKGLFGK
jgi:hypothetical protein